MMEPVDSGKMDISQTNRHQIAASFSPRGARSNGAPTHYGIPLNHDQSRAETSDTDPEIGDQNLIIPTPPPPLAWITSNMQETTRRTVIRSHIMLDYRRKHRLAETRSQRKPAVNALPLLARRARITSNAQYDLENSSPDEREDSQSYSTSLEPQENPILSIVDLRKIFGRENQQVPRARENWSHIDAWSTFTMLEIPVSERMKSHLHYFMNVMIAPQQTICSGTRIGLRRVWPALVQSNPSLLHAIIAVSASIQAARDAEIGHSDPQDLWKEKNLRPHYIDYLFHQAEAVRFINERLSDPIKAGSDATFGVVIFLICSDMALGHPERTGMHWKGLQQMINLRGNFESLPAHVSSFIGVIDVKFALVSATEPVYPAVRSALLSYPNVSTEYDLRVVGNRCRIFEGVPGPFYDELNSAICHLCDVTRYIESHRRKSNRHNLNIEFDDEHRTHIEHRLLSIPFSHHDWNVGRNSIEGCCRLGMLLFVNTVLWDGCSRSAIVIQSLVIQIKIALGSTELRSFYSSHLDMLIWILFLGGDASAGLLERAWFVSQLAGAATLRGLWHWKDVRESLLGFFYLDSAHQDAFQVLWAEVQGVMAFV